MDICIVVEEASRLEEAQKFAKKNGLELFFYDEKLIDGKPVKEGWDLTLRFTASGVLLRNQPSKEVSQTQVDFVNGANAHRRKFGGGKGQQIAKAVGVKSQIKPGILDVTAGMGGDAFVLAGLGCHVTMLERSPAVALLLDDGLRRASEYASEKDETLLAIIQRMKLHCIDSKAYLAECEGDAFDVVYVDPMFPERKKSAKVKKDMSSFHQLVGKDEDSSELLAAAFRVARHRVVVKRPKGAPCLNDQAPNYELAGKTARFDIYTKRKF